MKHTDSVNSDDSSRLPSDMGHTPTPYAFTARGTLDKQAFIYRNEPAGYATVARDVTEEDAAFIVRACNSHQALVEALQSLIDNADMQKGGGENMLRLSFSGDCLAKCRAALRSATP